MSMYGPKLESPRILLMCLSIDPIQKHFKLKYLYILFNLFKVYELKRYINLEPWIFFFCKNDMY